jgi:hypothetical protein
VLPWKGTSWLTLFTDVLLDSDDGLTTNVAAGAGG